MTENLFYGQKIRIVIEHVCSRAVPQYMRTLFRNVGDFFKIFLYNSINIEPVYPVAGFINKLWDFVRSAFK